MKIKFGIIGCGYIAQRHAKHIINHNSAVLTAVFDIDGERTEEFANRYQVKSASSLDDFFSHDFDIVCVCTPNGTHAELAILGLKSGKHVLVEKPMALSSVEVENMLSEAEKANKNLYVVKQNRYNPPVQAVKELVESEALGKLFAVHLNCFWNRNEAYYANSDWKGTKNLDGGVLYTQFSHFIDILYYLFGDIKDVQGQMGNFGHQHNTDFEDTGSFVFKFSAHEALGSFNFSTCSFEQNMEGSITILAEKGTVKIGGKYLNMVDYQKLESGEIEYLPASSPANNYGYYQGSMSNHDKVIHNVIETLNGREEIMTSAEDGRMSVKMIEEFYRAAKNG